MRSRLALITGLAGAWLSAGTASALTTLPFTEDFATDVAGWEDSFGAPLAFQPSGGPDGSSFASSDFNFFGFSSAFGGGPVTFRGNDSDDASGDAFVGDWLAAGVQQVSVFVRQETGVDLTVFLRVATAFNFPGAVFDNPTLVPSGQWTQLNFDIDPNSPLCTGEAVTCAEALANVGNLQFGTSAPLALTEVDQAFLLGLDQVTITAVPEPGTTGLLATGLAGLAALGRRRR
ncbi:PEP-CTERM sorting domain-containing protein [Myxococcota bacterium]|nr:PEP-CTERM sorting domain-containing protein [Myxococcota bacterium]MCZ7620785.1 PEP-CTERM sorting domain-containing protein [Myxococcota bacterium]